ncbi:hypothetical protein LRP88_02026 [Fusarium phalaenopsidis]
MSFSTWSQRYPDKLGLIKSHPAISMIIAGLSCFYAITLLTSYLFGVKVPYVGYRSLFEPTWFVRLRFVWAGGSIISEGYQKFKTSLFQVRKIGTDIIIIPPNYVDEVRKLSQDNTRSVEPFIHDFAGGIHPWAGVSTERSAKQSYSAEVDTKAGFIDSGHEGGV